jgi:hypothetical protein
MNAQEAANIATQAAKQKRPPLDPLEQTQLDATLSQIRTVALASHRTFEAKSLPRAVQYRLLELGYNVVRIANGGEDTIHISW